RLMQALPRDGQMAVVLADEQRVADLIGNRWNEVAIAAVNGPRNVVISGKHDAIGEVLARMKSAGIASTPLKVSHAFHSPLMEPMLSSFAEVAQGVTFAVPRIDVISNVTGERAGDEIATSDYWVRHIRKPVRFAAGIETLRRSEVELFVEIGPKPVLSGMGRQCLPEGYGTFLPSLRQGQPDSRQLLESLGELFVRGCAVDWRSFNRARGGRKIALPTYPFQRQRYWINLSQPEVENANRAAFGRAAEHPLLGRRVPSSADIVQYESRISTTAPEFLADHLVYHKPVVPGAAYVEMALAAATELANSERVSVDVEDVAFHQALTLAPQELRTVQLRARDGSFELSSLEPKSGEWMLHASGRTSCTSSANEPRMENLAALKARCPDAVDIDQFYDAIRSRGIEYGPTFRAVEKLWTNGSEAIGEIGLPGNVDANDHYLLHPVLFDASLQVLGACFPRDESDGVYLPVGIDRVRYRRHSGKRQWVHARLNRNNLSADFRLLDADGAVLTEVDGVHFKKATQKALFGSPLQNWLYDVEWRAQEIDGLLPDIADQRWMVIADVETTARFSAHLEQHGAMLSTGDCDVVVQICERDADPPTACAETLQLIQRLVRDGRPVKLRLVTRDAFRGALGGSALWGLGRVTALEHPELHIGMIDVDSGALDVARLVTEIASSNSEPQVALREQRFVARLVRSARAAGEVQLFADATYLITGGLSGLGLEVARWMIGAGARYLVLLSRNAANGSAHAQVEQLERDGASVLVLSADVADEEQLTRAFERIDRTMPPLRGIVHSAGVLDDGILLQQTAERFARVMAPKVRGAWNLHELTRTRKLDFFVLFSSAVSLIGNPGQANYAAANAFLDALSIHRHTLGLPSISINWGAWADVGAAAGLVAARGAAPSAIDPIRPEDGLEVFRQLLAHPSPQVAVMPVDWSKVGRTALSPFFSDFQRTDRGRQTPDLLKILHGKPAAEQRAVLTTNVEAVLSDVIGLNPSKRIDPDQGFFEMGMDSMMSLQLRNRLQSLLGCSLPATVAFDNGNLRALVDYVGRAVLSFGDKEEERVQQTVSDPALDALLMEVEQMPENEIRRLLTHA
nr:SDR family NAD(P)-dependent oxidoreductase [Acidobacteriota bacterium]